MTKGFKIRRAAAIAAAATLLFSETVFAGTCSLPGEQAAIDARVLQSELMVAGLSCGQSSQYNAFVQKFQGQLMANGTALRKYFARAYGGRGEDQMNQFVTRLANGASTHAMSRGTQAFCAESAALFGQVLSAAPGQLAAFAATVSFVGESGIKPCAVQAKEEAQR